MPTKNSHITVTDQFCGAGGSSQGVRNYSQKAGSGIEVKLALNHWKLAIETHNTNFPDTLHDCTDISACDPRRYPSTNILITSPECTNHSLAKGQKRKYQAQIELFGKAEIKPEEERSRATMWDVPRFAEYHDYEIVITENVVDARLWRLFDAWLKSMHDLGYAHKCCYINSMHCQPTPQSRDRMYVVFWKKGNKAPNLEFTPRAHCTHCCTDVDAYQWWKNQNKKWGKYRQQYLYRCPNCHGIVEPYYYASFNAIDWTNLGRRIGDRSKPLSHNTIKRIEYGLKKYCQTPVPFDIPSPFVFKGEHTSKEGYVNSIYESFSTQTTRQSMGLVLPYIIEMNRTGECKPSTEPAATITAGGINHALLSTEKFKSFISYYYGTHQASQPTEALGSITTKERQLLVSYTTPKIEDCYYRMLFPHELQASMAFDKNYKVLGTSKDKVKQLGNAVTPPVMEWLAQRTIESLN